MNDELDDIRESIRAVNSNIDTLAAFMAAFIDKSDKRFQSHDDLLQLVIDTQKHGYHMLSQEIQELKKIVSDSNEFN